MADDDDDDVTTDCLEADSGACYVALTERPLDVAVVLGRVRSGKAGANVLFSGSTRDNFDGRPVATLCYAAYRPRALRTMLTIAGDVRERHGLLAIAVVHRLGPVPIGEDSILIAVSAAHRQAAWRAGEECLEQVKARVEVWKKEVFVAGGDGSGSGKEAGKDGEGESVWRANREALPDGRRVGETKQAQTTETTETTQTTGGDAT